MSFTVENASFSEEPLAATSHKSGLVRLWTWALVEEGKKELKTEVSNDYSYKCQESLQNQYLKVTRTFRSIHTGPIALCRLHRLASGGKLLATGGTDGSVKVVDHTICCNLMLCRQILHTITMYDLMFLGLGLDCSVLHTQLAGAWRWSCLCGNLPPLSPPPLCWLCWGRSLLLGPHHL